jgi:hypothetical protein
MLSASASNWSRAVSNESWSAVKKRLLASIQESLEDWCGRRRAAGGVLRRLGWGMLVSGAILVGKLVNRLVITDYRAGSEFSFAGKAMKMPGIYTH